MLGKQKCKILKEIRQKIADENDIPYVTRECTHQGACKGTCPRCESELRYLEQQLAARQALGKKVAVAALCAGMAFTAAGCGPGRDVSDPWSEQLAGETELINPTEEPELFIEMGEVAWPDDEDPTAGEPEPDDPEEFELAGDVMYIPEDENGNG